MILLLLTTQEENVFFRTYTQPKIDKINLINIEYIANIRSQTLAVQEFNQISKYGCNGEVNMFFL